MAQLCSGINKETNLKTEKCVNFVKAFFWLCISRIYNVLVLQHKIYLPQYIAPYFENYQKHIFYVRSDCNGKQILSVLHLLSFKEFVVHDKKAYIIVL